MVGNAPHITREAEKETIKSQYNYLNLYILLDIEIKSSINHQTVHVIKNIKHKTQSII